MGRFIEPSPGLDHSDEDYAALAEADRKRRIEAAVEASYRNARREAGKRRTVSRRQARRRKVEDREGL